jgi:hypothetical protein
MNNRCIIIAMMQSNNYKTYSLCVSSKSKLTILRKCHFFLFFLDKMMFTEANLMNNRCIIIAMMQSNNYKTYSLCVSSKSKLTILRKCHFFLFFLQKMMFTEANLKNNRRNAIAMMQSNNHITYSLCVSSKNSEKNELTYKYHPLHNRVLVSVE